MTHPLAGKRIAFVGRLGGLNRREAQRLVRGLGGVFVTLPDARVDYVVVGDHEANPPRPGLCDDATRARLEAGAAELVAEDAFWSWVVQEDSAQLVRARYTPTMLAQLVGVEVSAIRRWLARGWLRAADVVLRLASFDFAELSVARLLAQLQQAGLTTDRIARQLAELAQRYPQCSRPLAELPLVVEGTRLLVRAEAGLVEPGGQRRIDFTAFDDGAGEEPATLVAAPIARFTDAVPPPADPTQPAQLVAYAAELEETGDLPGAIDAYRAALAAGGPVAEVCFQLAEALYRAGEPAAARERYYMALELDEDFVEARANLGCLLAELGQRELAVAALKGALAIHPDYADVHYHLARLLDELGQADEASRHWQRLLDLAPDSPWADEALDRLDAAAPLNQLRAVCALLPKDV